MTLINRYPLASCAVLIGVILGQVVVAYAIGGAL